MLNNFRITRRLEAWAHCTLAVLLLVAICALPLSPVWAATGVPKVLNYQGRLMDSGGSLLGGAGTSYCFKFSLYDNATVGAGVKLWPSGLPSTMTETVRNGVFTAGIGDVSAGGDVLDYNFQDNDTIYLNVQVATKVGATCAPGDGAEVFETLAPRNRIYSSGYAINASTLLGYTPAQSATGNQIPVLSSGSLVFGSASPFITATSTNALTLQGAGATGDVRFFGTSNKITNAGDLFLSGTAFANAVSSFGLLSIGNTATTTLQGSTTGTSTIQGFINILGTNSTSTFSGALAASGLSAFRAAFGTSATTTIDSAGNLAVGGNFSVAGNATLVNATSTNLAVTSVTSSILKTNASGQLVAAVAGTDYLASTFAYLFPNNTTSTQITFNGGSVSTNGTIGTLTSTSSTSLASTTLQGASLTGTFTATTSIVSAGTLTVTATSTFSTTTAASSSITTGNITNLFATVANIISSVISALTASVATVYTATIGSLTATSTANFYATANIATLNATSSATLASTTAYGQFITGNIISTSTATSTFGGPISVGVSNSSSLASFGGTISSASPGVGTSILSVTNNSAALSSGANAMRINLGMGASACTAGTTCQRFMEFYRGVTAGDTGGTGIGRINVASGGAGVTYGTGAADLAEYMVLSSTAAVGDIVSLNSSGLYQKAVAGQSIIGTISTSPGFVGNSALEGNANAYVVGFAGVVPTTVSTANGSITAGDLITAGATAGVGVKLLTSGYALGQALQAYSGAGTSTINVLVFPKYVDASIALESYGGGGGGSSGYWSLATSTGTVSLASTTYSLVISNAATLANASSTSFFAVRSTGSTASFGGTASTTIDNTGNTAVGGTLNVTGNTTLANATTTNLAITSVTSALHLANSTGGTVSYTGTSCTNQFIRSLNGSGVATCATVANADLANSAITINGASVSLGGSITVASTTLLTDSNKFTLLQSFNGGASSTGQITALTASSTNLFLSGIAAALLKTVNGQVTAAVAGSDYLTSANIFGYLFPGNATTTLLSLNGGVIANASSSITSLSVINGTTTNATTTNLAVTNIAGGNLSLTSALTVANGGSGATSFTSGNLIYGSGSGSLKSVATSSVSQGTAIALSGTGALVGAGGLTINFSAPSTAALLIPYASSTMITATSASSTNLTISGISSGILKTINGLVAAATGGTDFVVPATTITAGAGLSGGGDLSTNRTITLNLANANVWSALQQFNSNASSSQLSVTQKAYFGSSATTTIDSAGNVAVAGTLSAAGNTTLANATSTNHFTGRSTANTASFGATASSSFSSAGVLTLASALGVQSGGTGWANIAANTLLTGNGVGALATTSIGSSLSLSAATLSLNLANANVWNALQQFGGNASSSQTSAGTAYFGGTSTTTIDSTGNISFGNTQAYMLLRNGVDQALNIGTSTAGTPALTISTRSSLNGLVGIGTTSPWGKFSVEMGPINPALVVSNNGSSSPAFFIGGVNSNGFVGIGTSSPWAQFSINPTNEVGNAPSFAVGSSTGTFLMVSSSGKVGIGTTSPNYQLDVNGDVNIASGKCFRVNGVCIGYITKLSAIYATSTAGTTTVQFTGATNSTPSFSGATLTLPTNTAYYTVQVWGAGGGGGAQLTNAGTLGGDSCYSQNGVGCSTSAIAFATGGNGGANGSNGAGGAGGTGLRGQVTASGGTGSKGGAGVNTDAQQGLGGNGAYGGGQGGALVPTATPGQAGQDFGGGGGAGHTTSNSGGGGGGGGYASSVATTSISTTGTLRVGNPGLGGAAGTVAGGNGGNGGAVIMIYATSSPSNLGYDYAEMYPVSAPSINAGDIVAVDVGIPVSMKQAVAGDRAPLAGIISTEPGQVLGDQNAPGMRPVALSGRVPAKVNLEGGAIMTGDRIAISSVPGVGKKAGPFEDSVGIAIDNYDGTRDSGTVMVFLNLQRGIDINALAYAVLQTSSFNGFDAVSSTSTSPFDFVGGVMSAIGNRIGSLMITSEVATTSATTTNATSTSQNDSFAGSFISGIFAKIGQWLASATNGLGAVFANTFHAKEEICVDDQCLSRSDIQAMRQMAHGTPSSTPPASINVPSTSTRTAGSTTTPIISVQGNNPAVIEVGATYADLGALITGPQEALNLGIALSVDGVSMDRVQIDTSVVGVHTIMYSVVNGESTGTAQRIVHVVASPSAAGNTAPTIPDSVSATTTTP